MELMKKYPIIEHLKRDKGPKNPLDVLTQSNERKIKVSPQNKHTDRAETDNVIEPDGATEREGEEIGHNFDRSKDQMGNDLITFEVKTIKNAFVIKDM